MKGIFVILDGAGDLPCSKFNGKTPLEVANTPNLDFLATRGEMGYMYTVKPKFVPGSDQAIVSIFGNNLGASTRGQLEARGTNLEIGRGDLAFRVNFATIDSLEKGNLLDRRAGRTLTTKEAKALAKVINKRIKLPCNFVFEPTIQHRAVLVFKGNLSENILGNDPHPVTGKFRKCLPTKEDKNSQYTVDIINDFLEAVYKVLEDHPVNILRRKKGLMPANYILLRGAGNRKPKLKQYKKWVSPSYMPLEIGFSRVSGMKVESFKYPRLKGLDSYRNLWDGLKKECKFAKKIVKKNLREMDYAYIHVKETDLPGHDNKPVEKKLMIEYIDKNLFGFLKKFALKNDVYIVVTADHSTPCKLKAHSADPVPVLFFNNSLPQRKKFCEREAKKGKLGKMIGYEMLKKVGFVK